KFDTLKEALAYIGSIFSIEIDEWIKTSALLKDALYQERITKYLQQ
ncbi:hypothetical protein J7L27_01655, partial [Candidatus Bathyarchaeota archaeon]|nr:hypothetical protein [Candidatus Bathyarchaeota archaeon]